jgi:hypothetical protein
MLEGKILKQFFHHPLKVESTWDKFQFKKMEVKIKIIHMVEHDFSHKYIIVVYQYFDLRPKM